MAFEAHHMILVETPEKGVFVRVEGQVVHNAYSYDIAKLFDQHEVFYEGDDTYHVLVHGQKIPHVVAAALVRAAVSGKVKITKFQDFL